MYQTIIFSNYLNILECKYNNGGSAYINEKICNYLNILECK